MNLAGPRAKLARAVELRGELGHYIDQTLGPVANRPSIALRLDEATNEYVLYVDKVPDLNAFFMRVGLLVGDIVHNMRSALDHLVFQLALLNTSGSVARPDRTQFPISDTLERFDQAAARDLAEVAPRHRDVIEQFQPYHPMEENVSVGLYFHPLGMLRDLSNRDKHRILIPVLVPSSGLSFDGPAQWLALSALVMNFTAKVFRGDFPEAEAMVPGLELARLAAPSGTRWQPQAVGHAAAAVAFEDGRGVSAVVDKTGRAVDMVLSTFESDQDDLTRPAPAV